MPSSPFIVMFMACPRMNIITMSRSADYRYAVHHACEILTVMAMPDVESASARRRAYESTPAAYLYRPHYPPNRPSSRTIAAIPVPRVRTLSPGAGASHPFLWVPNIKSPISSSTHEPFFLSAAFSSRSSCPVPYPTAIPCSGVSLLSQAQLQALLSGC